jgi:lysophospholipase L1-like esterase
VRCAGLVLALGAFAAACASDRGAMSAPALAQPAGSAPRTAATARTAAGKVQSVAMVGDSITVRSEGALTEGFRRLGLDVREIDAASGRRMTAEGGADGSGLSALSSLAAGDRPDLWVIALGSNDLLQYDTPEAYRDQIVAVLNILPPEAPMVWVDIYVADDPARSQEFNQALRDTVTYRGNASVADWAAVAPGDGVLSDGVHPSQAGTQQFADVVMGAVEPWLH